VIRTPLSKQRNKHIQRVLVEAAKLAPKEDHGLALVYEKEKQKGNANRATIWMSGIGSCLRRTERHTCELRGSEILHLRALPSAPRPKCFLLTWMSANRN